jgi:hypothetical protein
MKQLAANAPKEVVLDLTPMLNAILLITLVKCVDLIANAQSKRGDLCNAHVFQENQDSLQIAERNNVETTEIARKSCIATEVDVMTPVKGRIVGGTRFAEG